MPEELHVLFGAGQVGQPLARILMGKGKEVRIRCSDCSPSTSLTKSAQ